MVRVLSLEAALAQGETRASILASVRWHEAAIEELERPRKKSTKAMGKPDQARALKRHKDTVSALLVLADQLAAQPKVAA